MSVVSLLSQDPPSLDSPANVDAAVRPRLLALLHLEVFFFQAVHILHTRFALRRSGYFLMFLCVFFECLDSYPPRPLSIFSPLLPDIPYVITSLCSRAMTNQPSPFHRSKSERIYQDTRRRSDDW